MQKVKEIVNLPVIKLKRETVIHNKVIHNKDSNT